MVSIISCIVATLSLTLSANITVFEYIALPSKNSYNENVEIVKTTFISKYSHPSFLCIISIKNENKVLSLSCIKVLVKVAV